MENNNNIPETELKTLPKKDPEKLHEGHRDKMRDRFIETGFSGFSEHQILEMILFYSYARCDTNEIAHRLINYYGSLADIIDASYDDLVENGHLPKSAAVLIKMITAVIPVYHDSRVQNGTYDNVNKIKDLFTPYFIAKDHEEFRVACFDSNLRLSSCLLINKGGLTSSEVSMRRLVEAAVKSRSSCVAIAHNHPKAAPIPSPDDVQTTKYIKNIIESIGISLLDHVIVGEKDSLSMRESAYLGVFD